MKVCALTTDLMDRSKLTAAIPGVQFSVAADADIVIVDLTKHDIAAVRTQAPNARIVAYGPHVDDIGDPGADVTLPRSRFFRDPGAAIS